MSSNSTHFNLASLKAYVDAQEKIIETLLQKDTQNYRFRNPNKVDWTRFWTSVWGKPLEPKKEKVVRDLHPIDDHLILPDVVPPFCEVVPIPETLDACWGGFQCKKLLF